MRLSRLSILVMLAASANAYAVTINATDEDLFVYDGNIDATGNRIGINAISGYDVTVLGDVNNETIGHANLKNRSERTESLKRK